MYHNLSEFETGLSNLAATYPATCRLICLPYETFEGRMVRGVRLGADGDRPAVLFWGGIHAREWMPPELCLSLAADFLEAYDLGTGLVYGPVSYSAAQIREILETYHLYFIPVSNPDGHQYSKTNDFIGGTQGWRRNRNPAESGGNPNCIGVDLNRNFDFLWDFPRHLSPLAEQRAISTDPCNLSQVYHGPSPNSEQESLNLAWLLDAYPQIRWFFDLHSYSELILFSWGNDETQTADSSQNFRNATHDGAHGVAADAYGEFAEAEDFAAQIALAEEIRQGIEAVNGRSYAPGESFGLYPTTGTTTDYVASRHFVDPSKTKVMAMTIEMGMEFRPPFSEAEEVIREVSSGLIRFLLVAESTTSSIT